MNPLKSVWGTIISGIILALLIGWGLSAAMGGEGNPAEWIIWFHVFVGIIWIGLLYYFNFVQVPGQAEAVADKEGPGPAAIGKYIAPRALAWFRWGALLTWLSGVGALWHMGILMEAVTFDKLAFDTGASVIGVGGWLGTIMLFNVWVLIWPNQKKILGMVQASDAEKASAKTVALMASRTNTLLSLPMLLAMTASRFHNGGLPF